MAKDGFKRPSLYTTNEVEKKVALRLCPLIWRNHKDYDPKFREQLRAANPAWFKRYSSVDENKEMLLWLAENNQVRPVQLSTDTEEQRLAISLINYTCASNRAHDVEFTKKLEKLRPDWFKRTQGIKYDSGRRKNVLLNLAALGMPRPSATKVGSMEYKLRNALDSLTKTKSRRYDVEFTNKIKALRPDWV